VKYLVDADWLIDAAIGRPVAVETLNRLTADGLAVSIIAVAEVYEEAFRVPDPEARLAYFRCFLSDFPVLPLNGLDRRAIWPAASHAASTGTVDSRYGLVDRGDGVGNRPHLGNPQCPAFRAHR
jgi:predicted nucleic acid-binding protein